MVVYTTDATFDGLASNTYDDGSGDNGVTFTFTGIPGNVTVPPTSFVSYGTINASVYGEGITIDTPITFILTIHQTGPTPSSRTFLILGQHRLTGSITALQ